jgi:hypothetical protein
MRSGLHSGPTTAGVLRGDRGRFQLCKFLGNHVYISNDYMLTPLFYSATLSVEVGDTVNTASRVESTGEKIAFTSA